VTAFVITTDFFIQKSKTGRLGAACFAFLAIYWGITMFTPLNTRSIFSN
jgi:hypothetical protein